MHRNYAFRAKQRGVTFIGWVFLLIPVAMVGYAAMLLTPIYLNYMRVARTMNAVAEEAKGDGSTSVASLRTAIDKQLDIDGVEYPATKDFVIRRDGQLWIIEISYEETARYVSDISLLATFRKTVQIGKGSIAD